MTEEQAKQSVRERLFKRRDIDENGCWHYIGASISNGYAWISYNGTSEYAHRVVAILFLNYDPLSGPDVCHTCDTPNCFNPSHLFIGTAGDNMRDAAAKGRMTGKKLVASQVARIKCELETRRTQKSLADEYGVSVTAIGQIARSDVA